MTVSVSIMQPYFFPYLGYYRLFQNADIFVVYDCVQFPRRGYVHRNRFRDSKGNLDWLTLPLKKAPQDVLIKNLEFVDDPANEFVLRADKFSGLKKFLKKSDDPALEELRGAILDFDRPVIDYLQDALSKTASVLGCSARITRSSELALPAELRGQDRILEIVKRLEGTRYINSPGGRNLYDSGRFDREGIALEFLQPYQGKSDSVLQLLISSGVESLQQQIRRL